MNWYLRIWADAINKAESSKSYMTHKDKMVTLLIMFSVAQGFNLLAIFFFLGSLFEFDPFLSFNVFPGKYLNTALSGIITLFLPFIILNYLLVFYKNRYKKFIQEKHQNTGWKVFIIYFLSSLLLFFLIIIIGKL
jgi:hypothetical protein